MLRLPALGNKRVVDQAGFGAGGLRLLARVGDGQVRVERLGIGASSLSATGCQLQLLSTLGKSGDIAHAVQALITRIGHHDALDAQLHDCCW